jgi:hypothetical protein
MGSPLIVSVIAPCTGRKNWRGPSLNPAQLALLHAGLLPDADAWPRFPATELYAGLGHLLLRRGIDAFRAGGSGRLDFHIVSAGMGVIEERTPIPPYEATFLTLRGRARRAWAAQLGIPRGIADVFAQRADLRLVLLGREYLEVCALPAVTDGTPTIVLAAPSAADLVPPGALHVPLQLTQAKRFHATLIALKGELVRRLLSDGALWRRPDVRQIPAWRDARAFLDLCESCAPAPPPPGDPR